MVFIKFLLEFRSLVHAVVSGVQCVQRTNIQGGCRMTSNQIAYMQALETSRSNKVNEEIGLRNAAVNERNAAVNERNATTNESNVRVNEMHGAASIIQGIGGLLF